MAKASSNRSFSQTAASISMRLKPLFGSPKINAEFAIIKRTRRYQIWRDFMQGIFDKIYPYQKYNLDWDKIDNLDIKMMDAVYDKMPNFQQFIDGKPQH